MVKGIIGKKVGMTQLFDENGKVIPVTVIEAGPCTVVQKKTVESDGYQAVQLGFGEVSAKKVNKAAAGHFKKANVAPKKTLREFRLEDVSAMNVGDVLKADVFAAGDKVDVVGPLRLKVEEDLGQMLHRDLFAQPLGADGVVLAEAALQGAAGEKHRAAAPCAADTGFLPEVEGGAGGL